MSRAQLRTRPSGQALASGRVADRELQAAIDATRGQGAPLDLATRTRVGAILGDPLVDVRLHSDAIAGQLADAVAARAFTTGRDIYFASGEHRPGTPDGNRLLAHELAHVVQQRGLPERGPLSITHPHGPEERAADRVAAAATTGTGGGTVASVAPGSVGAALGTGPSLQRWPKLWPFSRSGGAASTPAPDIQIGGPAPAKSARSAPPLREFVQHAGRRRVLAEWARQQKSTGQNGQGDVSHIDEQLLSALAVAGPFVSWNRPSYAEAPTIVRRLRACSHPAVQRLIREAEGKYAPYGVISKLEDTVISEEVYRQRHGGSELLAGLAGHLFNLGDGPYSSFSTTEDCAKALGLREPPAPPPRTAPPSDSQVPTPTTTESTSSLPSAQGPGVRALRDQLGDVIGQVRPGAPPPRPPRPPRTTTTTASATVDVASEPPTQRITLADRVDPRATERRVLTYVRKGEAVPPELLDRLAAKMSKQQSQSRGREVTAATEAEYEEMFSLLSADDRRLLVAAAKNYTGDSARINAVARNARIEELQVSESHRQDLDRNVQQLDAMFSRLDRQGLTAKQRIVYRRTKYKPNQSVPYGDTIKVGDVIGDKGFVSTSENRQFLLEARDKKRDTGVRFVMFTIIGTGGLNVSGAGDYTNANALRLKELNKRTTVKGVADRDFVGQAEILFPRNSLFRVESIARAGADLHVVLTTTDAQKLQGKRAKDAFSGGALSA